MKKLFLILILAVSIVFAGPALAVTLTWDAGRGRVVMFGGNSSANYVNNDT